MKVGLLFIFGFVVLIFGGPLFVEFSAFDLNLADKLLSPSLSHPMGTDSFGTDVLAATIYGARQSLLTSVLSVLISVILAMTIGTLASTTSKWVDNLVMAIIQVMSSFPSFLMALAIVSFMGQGQSHLIFAFGLTGWVSLARIVRVEISGHLNRQFIEATRASGSRYFRVVVLHLWPQLIPILVVQIPLMLAGVIIGESSLTFLGLGVSPDLPSWGGLLNQGRMYLITAPHITVFPGLTLMILICGLLLIGDDLRRKYQR